MDQQEFVKEHQAESVGIARRMWAVEKPYVVHYLGCRAQPPQAKPDSERFATLEQAEEFAQRIVREWGTAAASIWEEVPRGIALGESSDTVLSPLIGSSQ